MKAFLRPISTWLAGIACAALVFVMIVQFLDVVGRYFFNAPLTFAVELVQLGMGLLVLFGLAITTLERGHIAVDLIEGAMPPVGLRILASIAAVCGLIFISLMAWRLLDRGLNFKSDGLATDILYLPVWPVVIAMAFAALVAAFAAAAHVFRPSEKNKDLLSNLEGIE